MDRRTLNQTVLLLLLLLLLLPVNHRPHKDHKLFNGLQNSGQFENNIKKEGESKYCQLLCIAFSVESHFRCPKKEKRKKFKAPYVFFNWTEENCRRQKRLNHISKSGSSSFVNLECMTLTEGG